MCAPRVHSAGIWPLRFDVTSLPLRLACSTDCRSARGVASCFLPTAGRRMLLYIPATVLTRRSPSRILLTSQVSTIYLDGSSNVSRQPDTGSRAVQASLSRGRPAGGMRMWARALAVLLLLMCVLRQSASARYSVPQALQPSTWHHGLGLLPEGRPFTLASPDRLEGLPVKSTEYDDATWGRLLLSRRLRYRCVSATTLPMPVARKPQSHCSSRFRHIMYAAHHDSHTQCLHERRVHTFCACCCYWRCCTVSSGTGLCPIARATTSLHPYLSTSGHG